MKYSHIQKGSCDGSEQSKLVVLHPGATMAAVGGGTRGQVPRDADRVELLLETPFYLFMAAST